MKTSYVLEMQRHLSIFLKLLLFLSLDASASKPEPSVAYIRKHAIEMDGSVDQAIISELSIHKVVIIGEMHGTTESPNFILALARMLVQNKKSVLIALEIPGSSQSATDEFVLNGQPDVLAQDNFFKRDYQDGRSSQAMVAMLTGLRTLPSVHVYDFDTGPRVSDGADRDLKMAKNLVEQIQKAKPDITLVLTGNIHGKLRA